MATTVNNTHLVPSTNLSLPDLVEAGAVDSVLLALPDLQGRLKGKLYDTRRLLTHVAPHGTEDVAGSDLDGGFLVGHGVGEDDGSAQHPGEDAGGRQVRS